MTRRSGHHGRGLKRFLRRQDGVALIEFAISFPAILIILFTIIEASRMLFAYQAAIGGVRDAARYFARMVPADVCPDPASPSDAEWDAWVADAWTTEESMLARAADIVGAKIGSTGSVFPGAASLTGNPPVTVTYECPVWTSPLSLSQTVPVIAVEATVRIDFPFGNIFALFGGPLAGVTATIADTSRALGS